MLTAEERKIRVKECRDRIIEKKKDLKEKFPELYKYICKVSICIEKSNIRHRVIPFDYMVVNTSIAISNQYKCYEFVKNNKAAIIKYILYNIDISPRFKKYNLPIELLNIDEFALTNASFIHMKLSIDNEKYLSQQNDCLYIDNL